MTKIIKKEQDVARLPISDWDIFPWSKEMYERHESDFQRILLEYRAMRVKYNDDARMARWRWIESYGGLKMILDNYGILQPNVSAERYQHYSDMFERFDDWLSFKEKREMSVEEQKTKIDAMKSGIKPVNFSIPKKIIEGMERDISNDEITQDALDNF